MRQLQEVAQQLPALAGQHRLGMELHAVDRELRCRTPMIVPSSVRAADFERVRQRIARRPASDSARRRTAARRRGTRRGRRAAPTTSCRASAAARGRPRRRTRCRCPGARGRRRAPACCGPNRRITSTEMPGVLRPPGPGEMTMRSGCSARDLVERDLVVAAHQRRRAELAEVLREVVGERIVVVDAAGSQSRLPPWRAPAAAPAPCRASPRTPPRDSSRRRCRRRPGRAPCRRGS